MLTDLTCLRWYVTNREREPIAANFGDYSKAHRWCKRLCMRTDACLLIWHDGLVMGVVASPDVDLVGLKRRLARWNQSPKHSAEYYFAKKGAEEDCGGLGQLHQWVWGREGFYRKCKACGVIGSSSFFIGRPRVYACKFKSGDVTWCGKQAKHMVVRPGLSLGTPVCDEHQPWGLVVVADDA